MVDDRLQPPEGPSAHQKAGGGPRGRDHEPGKHKNPGRTGVAHPPPALGEEQKPAPAPAPAPATLAQQPPNAPQVSFRNGLLTVTANNSTLGDILNQVRSKTGARIEYPDSLSQERVAAVVGPAPAPQVLATLLNGTRYDYILLGVDGRPDLLQRAIITSREAGGAAPPAPTAQARATTRPAAADEESDVQPDETVEQPEEAPQPPPQPVQQPGPQGQPFPQLQVPQPQLPQPQGEPPQPGQPKTPEQLLQELQRMQQKQQEQQQPPPE